ncbi:MAG: hypothetical protein JWL70_3091, partial [Acidimicrobiia bacterium]|nr:hypothetical protein [Acidimicrobiia bacterium]
SDHVSHGRIFPRIVPIEPPESVNESA